MYHLSLQKYCKKTQKKVNLFWATVELFYNSIIRWIYFLEKKVIVIVEEKLVSVEYHNYVLRKTHIPLENKNDILKKKNVFSLSRTRAIQEQAVFAKDKSLFYSLPEIPDVWRLLYFGVFHQELF